MMTKDEIRNKIAEYEERAEKYREYIGELCYDGDSREILFAAQEIRYAEDNIAHLKFQLKYF